MPTLDPRIDAYIAKAAEFARPILAHLRGVVHAASPEIEETIKWGSPHFMHKGMLCGMSAFRQHCAFGFWKGPLIFQMAPSDGPMAGQFGRITSVKELPPKKVLIGYVKKAMQLNADGVKAPAQRKPKPPRPALPVPPLLTAALAKNRKAREAFEAFSPSHRREYSEWIAEARGEDTRTRRVAQAVGWLAEGTSRNRKYAKR